MTPFELYGHKMMANDPNYDGQGKSRAQETRDSVLMLAYVLRVMVLGLVVLGWVIWEVGR